MSNLISLDSASLESVTGGTDHGHHPYGGAANTATLDALSGISSSLSSIRNQGAQSQGGLFNNPTNMMMFAMCLANRPAPASNVVVVRHW
ncbi:MAG TPA: hypothetical protein VGM39_03920 [Kofleriaceae bacterium]|jgi:hypothetical protein